MTERCSHLDQIHVTTRSREGCQKCLEMGDTWVHLRQCLVCGHVGCCDASRNHHATTHAHSTGHPLIMTLERGEDWVYCYVDGVTIDPPPW